MPPRHRFLEPIHNVKEGQMPQHRGRTRGFLVFIPGKSLLPRRRQSGSGGGASRDRTDDLKLAKLALSQLSYGPTEVAKVGTVYAGSNHLEWWAE